MHRTRKVHFLCTVFGLAIACETPLERAPVQSDVVDLRVDYPAPDNGIQVRTPALAVGPYEEVMYCYYTTYTGPTSGIVGMIPFYSKTYGHHMFLKAVPVDKEYEDESLVDCTEAEPDRMPVLVQAVQNEMPDGTGDWVNLMPGYAFRLEEGQQFKIDAHFINPTDQSLLLNTAVNLELIPEEEVDHWVGSFDMDGVNFEIPPGVDQEISFDCALPTGSSVLSVGGHMHENGSRYLVELIRNQGSTPILEVDDWQSSYRYTPPTRFMRPGEVTIQEGDRLRTTCTWDNPYDAALTFPDEMCTTFGVASDLKSAYLCENGHTVRDGQ